MPEVVATCSHLLVDGYDFSGQLTEVFANRSSESLDVSVMGTATRKHKGGVKDASITAKGYLNLGSSLLDPVLFAGIGTDCTLVTMFTNGISFPGCSTAGGYAIPAVSVKYPLGGSYGSILPFDFEAQTYDALSPCIPMSNTLSTAWGIENPWTTGNNTTEVIPLSTNGWSTNERLYGGLHLTALSTSIVSNGVTAIIAAASSSGFLTSSTRITFGAKTCKSGTWATPIASANLSTDQPFVRAVITIATGTSTGYNARGLLWVGMI